MTVTQVKLWWLKVVVGCGIILLPVSLFALDPEKSIAQFNCQTWTRQSGLPGDVISAIAQTKDGYIWLGTQQGLVRFDGLEFKVFSVNLPQAQGQEVRSISSSKNVGLWFGINYGSFGYFDGKNFSAIEDEKWVIANMNASVIRETRDGAVWTGGEHGLGRWVKGKPDDTFFDENFGALLSIYESPRGRIFIGSVEQGLFYWQFGKLVPFPDDSLKKHNIFALVEDVDGNIWVGTEIGLRCYDSNFKPKAIPEFRTETKALLVDRHGDVWIGTTGAGLARYRNGGFTFFNKKQGLAGDNVISVCEDIEGSLWVGTQDGLSQLSDVKTPIYSASEGLIEGSSHAVSASPRGGLWITTSRGVSYFDGVKAANYTNYALLPSLWFKTAYEARNGDVYLVDGEKTLVVLSEDKVVAKYTNDLWPMTITEDAESILTGVGRTLCRVKDGRMYPYVYKSTEEPVFYWINNLYVAKNGAIWVASNNGIFRIKDGVFKQWSTPEGLSATRVYWVCEDVDGSIWAGLSTGVARIKDDQLKCIGPENGLDDINVYAIVPDDQGYFWMASGRSIFRVARKSLNDFADGKADRVQCEVFDGPKAARFSGRTDQEFSGCKTLDGRIWFPNPRGVLMIDPTNFFVNHIAPPVYIQQIRINGVELKDKKVSALHPGDAQMEFSFTALSYISPQKLQIRYQLEGFDNAWVDAAGRRSVLYNNLKPGKYNFRVQACNADGVWNTAGDSFAVELPPPFYQTAWFRVLAGLLGGVAVFGGYQWKVRRLEYTRKKLQEAHDLLEAKIGRRTDELARANAALRQEIKGHQDTEAKLTAEIAEREKSDKALAEQRNLLRTLIDTLPDKIFVKDAQSRVLISNLAHAQALGASAPEEVVGKTDFDYFAPELAGKFQADEQLVLKMGTVYHAEEKGTHLATGENHWNQTTKVPLRDDQGNVIGLAGILRDITDRKEWESRQEALHKQLMAASRHAGMAEVATGVLHNVGNVLNSVNISASVVMDKVRASKAAYLTQAAAMLREHETDLARFLTQDPKGRHLPGYLENLATHFSTENAALLEELQSLTMNIEHIKKIVAMQQSNARLSGVVETVPVTELVEDALQINIAAFQRHDVKLVRQFEEVPAILVDRHKVLQILVNLLQNAKYACDEKNTRGKQVTVWIRKRSEDRIQIGVADNGVGIAPENLNRVFEHGFTTRKNGHGFGLHSGALAAMELGGSLTVQSEGRGRGASFIVELPVHQNTAPAEPVEV